MKYTAIYFDGELKTGAYVQNAMVEVPEDYTMAYLIREIKEQGYISFKLDGMRRLVKVPEAV